MPWSLIRVWDGIWGLRGLGLYRTSTNQEDTDGRSLAFPVLRAWLRGVIMIKRIMVFVITETEKEQM